MTKSSYGVLLSATLILFSGCGDDSGGSSKMSDKKMIVIYQDIEKGVCKGELKRWLRENFYLSGLLLEEKSWYVECTDYGRIDGGNSGTCGEIYYGDGSFSCVAGFDSYTNRGASARSLEDGDDMHNLVDVMTNYTSVK